MKDVLLEDAVLTTEMVATGMTDVVLIHVEINADFPTEITDCREIIINVLKIDGEIGSST